MNITLSADEKLVKKARAYAKRHGTSLNQEIRQHMKRITGMDALKKQADEFAELAKTRAGESPAEYVFNRDEARG